MHNVKLLNNITVANSVINNYCLSGLYDETDIYQKTYQKITNLSNTLLNTAIRLSKGQKPLLYTKKLLSVKDIERCMKELCQILSTPDFMPIMEKNIFNLIRRYSLCPAEIFIENPPDALNYHKSWNLVHGI